MDRCVRLVFVPGNPVTLHSLCPKSHLLMLQSRLIADGVTVDLVDLGSVGMISAAANSDAESTGEMLPGWMEQVVQGWGGFPVFRRIKTAQAASRENAERTDRLARLSDGRPRIMAFWVEDRHAYREIKELSRRLHDSLPGTRQVLAGPYAVHYGACALSDCPGVDAVITGDATDSLLSLLEADAGCDSWHAVPGMMFRSADGGVRRQEARDLPYHVAPLAIGGFQPQEASMQFPLFPLTFNLSPAEFYYQDCSRQESSIKSPEALVEEMKFLHRHYSARVFHISAPYILPGMLAEFADLLLKQNVVVIYSLGDQTESIGGALSERLFASGCRAMSYRVPTGSQRMLEDFYGCSASISAMRASLRHSKAAGIFTVIRVCYPCPEDDYHTRAEIELFIEASKPDAVCIESPRLAPDSLWFRRASEFGFFINHKDYHRFVVGGNSTYGPLPYTMRGWSSKRIHQEQAALTAVVLKAGCMVGVTEQQGVLARLVRSAREEARFLEELQGALDEHDPVRLRGLMDCANTNARTLSSGTVGAGIRVGKAVSFS